MVSSSVARQSAASNTRHATEWRWLRRLTTRLALAALSSVTAVGTAGAHPLHTTLTEISMDAKAGGARIVIRAFIDDFGAAAARLTRSVQSADHSVSADVLQRYIVAKLVLADGHNQRVTLQWEGMRREGDVVWMTLRAPALTSLRGARLGSTLLFEKFDDQVNIVQVVDGTTHRSMLFTSGDGTKVKALM